MSLRRNASIIFLVMCTAMSLVACGGGGDGGTPPPPPAPPTVITSPVNAPNIDNAVINGSVNPNGLESTGWFEYGTDSALSSFTKTADHPTKLTGTVPQSINASLTGLAPGTKYYYRVAASSTAGTSKGTIESFTTTSPPPTTVTTQAGNITITSATLNGSVNPNGLATTAWFEYGTDASLSTFTKTGDQVNLTGKAPVLVSQAISGLIASTTYYFRVAASSTGGQSKGTILSFSTSANPPPIANAGTDQSAFMGNPVTLDGSGSSDGGNGGTITYLWTQVAGPTATLSGATTANPTFVAPAVTYPSGILTFQLTVTSSRGPTASDSVNVTDKWGFFDDFSTNTTAGYTTVLDGSGAAFTYDATGKRVQVLTGNDNLVTFSRSVPPSTNGVFSLDFNPTARYPSHGGIWIRLMQDSNNYYEISNFDYGGTPIGADVAGIRKFSGGVKVGEVTFATAYGQGSTYPIKITFSGTQVVMEAFGLIRNLPFASGITVNRFEVETGQQDAYYDNIKLEAAP